MLKKISIILALLVLTFSVLLQGTYSGYERGFHDSAKDCASFYSAHNTVYADFAYVYSIIKWLLLAFVISKLIKKEWLSQIICLSSLIWAIFEYREIYIHKSDLFRIADIRELKVFDLILETIPIDWFCFAIIVILLIYQIISVVYYLFYKNRSNQMESV